MGTPRTTPGKRQAEMGSGEGGPLPSLGVRFQELVKTVEHGLVGWCEDPRARDSTGESEMSD